MNTRTHELAGIPFTKITPLHSIVIVCAKTIDYFDPAHRPL
jgi:hypothetical protein